MKKIILDIKGRFLFNIVAIRDLYIQLVPYGLGLNTFTVVMPNIYHLHVCRGRLSDWIQTKAQETTQNSSCNKIHLSSVYAKQNTSFIFQTKTLEPPKNPSVTFSSPMCLIHSLCVRRLTTFIAQSSWVGYCCLTRLC